MTFDEMSEALDQLTRFASTFNDVRDPSSQKNIVWSRSRASTPIMTWNGPYLPYHEAPFPHAVFPEDILKSPHGPPAKSHATRHDMHTNVRGPKMFVERVALDATKQPSTEHHGARL